MSLNRLLGVLALVGAFAVGGALLADEKEAKDEGAKFKATCPVSGGAAKETSFVEVHGKKIYFCCDNCPKAYKASPDKFTAKMHRQLLQTGQMVQVACPFSGEAVDPETKVEFGGTDVCFCCNDCKGKFEKASDDEKVALVFKDITKGFTLQTTCPVSGKAIKADHVVEHDGKKVYFCCENCPAAFEKDPAKFTAKLPQFSKE